MEVTSILLEYEVLTEMTRASNSFISGTILNGVSGVKSNDEVPMESFTAVILEDKEAYSLSFCNRILQLYENSLRNAGFSYPSSTRFEKNIKMFT